MPRISSAKAHIVKRSDDYESLDYRDSKEFKSLMKIVKDFIAEHGSPTSREINRFIESRTSEALHMLQGDIEEVGINLVRYQIANVRRVEAEAYNDRSAPAIPASKLEPFALLDGLRPNITA